MEVHHHPHAEKKSFKEYFLEFLMIFLAVTMGFFAENIRETFNDKGNMHQLAISLMNDLKMDTTHLAAHLQSSNLKIKQLDSLHAILQQPKDKINNLDLQRLVVGATLVFNFVPSGGTISEMKSTEMISKQNIVDSILSYDYLYQQFKVDQDLLHLSQLQDYRAIMIRVFNIHVFNSMVSEESGNISIPAGNPPLFNDDPKLINELLMRVHLAKRNILTIIKSDLPKLENKASILIDLIKKEYQLK